MKVSLQDITIRTTLQPGDIGFVIYLHGIVYGNEYNYGIPCEVYIAEGLCEFYHHYDTKRDRVWVAEHNGKIVGFILLMHRDIKTAQLRYFIIDPAYRGIGLGKKLMSLYMEFLVKSGYTSSYLWTTSDLPAAAGLYKRNGFTLTEEKFSDAFDKPILEQRYDWLLNG